MKRPRLICKTRQSGFTLLEVLVVLLVLGLLILGINQGTRFGLQAWEIETRLVDDDADMDGVERVLRNIISEADPGDPTGEVASGLIPAF